MFLSSDKEPKKVHLQRVLGPIKHKWREIGEALEIPDGRIQSIDHDPHYNDSNKLSEVLQTWIDTQPSDVTWRNLIDVITEYPVNESVLAKTILDFLANPKITPDTTDSSCPTTTVESMLGNTYIITASTYNKYLIDCYNIYIYCHIFHCSLFCFLLCRHSSSRSNYYLKYSFF